MEIWNREELYSDVWEQPLIKLTEKYAVSAVMLGKVCRKLKIPLPGRGYWARKQAGQTVSRKPLPEAKNLPVLQRVKTVAKEPAPPQPEPTDPEYLQIKEVESRQIPLNTLSRHKSIEKTEKHLLKAKPDDRAILHARWDETCLDIRVTRAALGRALGIINTIILALESEKFPVRVETGKHGGSAQIFGFDVPFAITEKVHVIGRRELKEPWTHTVIDHEGTGILEMRIGDYAHGDRVRDSKRQRLEDMLAKCVGGLMREARERKLRAERHRQMEIVRQKKAIEIAELRPLIEEEEKKVKDLNRWVDSWLRAKEMRGFIADLEQLWIKQGHDLSAEQPKGQRITWMKQQADRLDPMISEPPPSILDRKRELDNRW